MYQLFAGGYNDLSIRGGYLVESGRANCCSWEFHLYKLPAKKHPLRYDDMDYMVVITYATETEPEKCEITRMKRAPTSRLPAAAKQLCG